MNLYQKYQELTVKSEKKTHELMSYVKQDDFDDSKVEKLRKELEDIWFELDSLEERIKELE